jgi:hypothetical protein
MFQFDYDKFGVAFRLTIEATFWYIMSILDSALSKF